jgi:PAS domain-containing protein
VHEPELPIEGLARAVLDSLPANTAVVDTTGRVRAVNQGWARFVADRPDDVWHVPVGESWLDRLALHAPTDEDAARALLGTRAVLAGDARTYHQD